MTRNEFDRLLLDLATGWENRRYEEIIGRFAPGVEYADPLRYRLSGRDALMRFFSGDEGAEQQVAFHLSLFDEERQIGAAEYTYRGSHLYHGVVLVRIEAGLITHWREYQHTTDQPWETFVGATRWKDGSTTQF